MREVEQRLELELVVHHRRALSAIEREAMRRRGHLRGVQVRAQLAGDVELAVLLRCQVEVKRVEACAARTRRPSSRRESAWRAGGGHAQQ
eukprot:2312595-Prymnesium_polylepis.1